MTTRKKKPSGTHYVVCVRNNGYFASLELRKIYSLVPDKTAGKSGLLRAVDESEEDYLYPADYFCGYQASPHSAEGR
jgi:hypothetical protein